MSATLNPIRETWFEHHLSALRVDLKQGPASIQLRSATQQVHFDLRGYNFISLFDLLNLFLLIDYCQAQCGEARLYFTGMGSTKEELISIDVFNELRRERRWASLSSEKLKSYYNAEAFYTFIGFFNHFGFFDAMSVQRRAGRVICSGLTDALLDRLYMYRGISEVGSKVLPLKPIWGQSDCDVFRTKRFIRAWLDALPLPIREAPVLMDGEFSQVFGYQLGHNIIEHSGEGWQGEFGSLGAVAMRILPPALNNWIKNSFPSSMHRVFTKKNKRGVLEICVGDRGRGIVASLGDQYKSLLNKFGQSDKIDDLDVIAFAFDEMGTSKNPETRWGGVHALHRILSCTAKYEGILRLRTSGFELIYDATEGKKFARGMNNFGLYPGPQNIHKVLHPLGLQMQILLPLIKPERHDSVIVRRGDLQENSTRHLAKIMPASPNFLDADNSLTDERLRLRLTTLSNSLMEEPASRPIGYDFGGYRWKEEELAFFLYSQKSVLHTHRCFGLGLDPGTCRALTERERLDPLEDTREYETPRSFFNGLSAKHRLFPVMDTSNRVWWFGFGPYRDFESCANLLMENKEPLSFDNLLQHCGIIPDSSEAERLALYLRANDQLFTFSHATDRHGWISLIHRSDLLSGLRHIIHLQLQDIMHSLGCIHGSNSLYKLPSRDNYATQFIQTTGLFQTPLISEQMAEWLALAVRLMVKHSKELLFVTATAPAELMSRAIIQALPEFKIHLLNLGYFSALDEEKLITSRDWPFPTLLISDIVDRERTIGQMFNFIRGRGLNLVGLVALIRFLDAGKDTIETAMKWSPSPAETTNNEIPRFFLAEMLRPEQVSEQRARETFDEDHLQYVEPYSLELFQFSSLTGTRRGRLLPKEKQNLDRLRLLDEIGVLRSGHWVFGTHHFKLTTCVKTMLDDQRVGGRICGEIIRICNEKSITHILLPLHSRIGGIIPRVLSGIKLILGRSVEHTFCISTKSMGKRPFYVLPTRIKSLIETAAKNQQSGQPGPRFLILDDAVASGRTLETMLRALMLRARHAFIKYKLGKCPIEYVHAYAIIDRQGLARGTAWRGIRQIALESNDLNNQDNDAYFDFRFESWINLDMPV